MNIFSRIGLLLRLSERPDILQRIDALTLEPIPAPAKDHVCISREDLDEFNRLKQLAEFSALSGKAKQIEEEWQKIQQEEHNADFAYQTLRDEHSLNTFIYKKGIVDGIKWCVKHFS